jgi:hypothetical protein
MVTSGTSFTEALAHVRGAFNAGALHDWQVYVDQSERGNGYRHIVVLPAESADWVEFFDEGDASE